MASSIPPEITIPTGMLARCFNVVIVDDLVKEPNEGFQITARLQGDATVSATTGVTIFDDDRKPKGFLVDLLPRSFTCTFLCRTKRQFPRCCVLSEGEWWIRQRLRGSEYNVF